MWPIIIAELLPVIIDTAYGATGIVAWIIMFNAEHEPESVGDHPVNYLQSNDPNSDFNSDFNNFEYEIEDMENYIESYWDSLFF